MIPALLIKTLASSAFSFFGKKSKDELYMKMFLELAKVLAQSTDNTLDDKMVQAIEKCLLNQDSGLQRKPTGPRAKRPR